MTPKISVIIPVYNAEKYLEKCLDSVLGQTLSPIEVICVDDGSTDASPEILARYAAEHENLRILRQENSGPSVARNAALDVATGEYILFVDSDDYLVRETTASELYEHAAALDLDELFYDALVDCDDPDMAAQGARFARHYLRKGSYPDVLSGQEMFCRLAENGDYICAMCLRIHRRTFLEEHHLRLPTGIIHEDEVFCLECMSLERRAAHHSAQCYGRRVHADSLITARNLPFSILSFLTGVQELERFARQRLTGASATFMRRYRWRLRVLVGMAADQYSALDREARGKLFTGCAPSARRRFRRILLVGLLRRRGRRLVKRLRSKR